MRQNFVANADELSDSIEKQIENIDLTDFENYLTDLGKEDGISEIKKMLSGEFEYDYLSIINFVTGGFISKIKTYLPVFLSVIGIAVFLSLVQGLKSVVFNDGVYESVFFACFLTIVLLLLGSFSSILLNTKNCIENMAKVNEIMSPIILTLMISSGKNAAINVFRPSVLFLSGGVIEIITLIVLPLICAAIIFGVVSYFSKEIKLKKFSDFFTSVIKWIFGLTACVYGVFLTVQGIGSMFFDGISIKAAKYVLSNAVPIVGGLIKDGFDIIVAGSVLIKNTLGIAFIIALFYTVIPVIAEIAAFSVLLRLTGAITESFSDDRVSGFCTSLSKYLGFIVAALLIVLLMFFITALFMILSANGGV